MHGRLDQSTWNRAFSVILVTVFLSGAQAASADETKSPPTVYSRAIEFGVDGAMTTIEGITTGSLMVRGGMFANALGGLAFGEVIGAFRHVSSLDVIDLEAAIGWQKRLGNGGNYPYVSIGGGVRHEDLGSFAASRFPFGFAVGLRSLFGQRAGLRVEYRFRRIFNDPVADFSEHQIVIGLSLYFKNRGDEPLGE